MSAYRFRRLRAVVALVLSSLLFSGCEFDIYKLPLPGGADVGDDPITVTVEFEDVLDLVPRSAVKYNEVSVGQVSDVDLGGEHDRTAIVELQLRNDTGLPANAIASIRQTSLLGEKFVSLAKPTSEPESSEPLGDGDVIPLSRSGRNPEVEEVLGALSLILNGGGVAQLKSIANEVNVALGGREDTARSVLTQVNSLVSQLDDRKGDITRALSALNSLAKGVRKQQGSIDRAMEELPSALDSLDRQRGDLVRMLAALNRLSNVGVKVIRQTKGVTIESLRLLLPVLTQLSNSGESLAYSLQAVTFPFIDAAVGRNPQVAKNLAMGDYINLSIELDVDLANPQVPTVCLDDLQQLPCDEVLGSIVDCINDSSTCTNLSDGAIDAVCETLPLPICGGAGAAVNRRSAPQQPDDLAGLDLGSAGLDDLGLNRAPVGGAPASESPLRDLGKRHDQVLVALLGAPLAQGGDAS